MSLSRWISAAWRSQRLRLAEGSGSCRRRLVAKVDNPAFFSECNTDVWSVLGDPVPRGL